MSNINAADLAEVLATALGKKTVVAEVVRTGERIVIPEMMSTEQAIDTLKRKLEAEEQTISISHFLHVFPWEGALALQRAVDDVLGFVELQEVRTFFGKKPPQKITIPVGPDETIDVMWGRIGIHPDGSFLHTSADFRDDTVGFLLGGEFKRKHEHVVKKIVERLQHHLRTTSIYRGRPLMVSFRDEDGDRRPVPSLTFYDIRNGDTSALTFSRDIEVMIGSNIFAPIKHREVAKQCGIPFKRGVMLAGPYGTGKTLLARRVAQLATDNQITFIYVKDVRELADAVSFARQMQPAVIFGEDIDRALGDHTRTTAIDNILNTIDGIDSKSTDVMVILTTNHLDKVNKAMLRPGRIDVLVNVMPPDAEAAVRLVKVYGRSLIVPNADYSAAGEILAGMIPAVIREIVERSKLVHLHRTGEAPAVGSITPEDIVAAAKSMEQQLDVLNERVERTPSDIERAASVLGASIGKALLDSLDHSEKLSQESERRYAEARGGNGSRLMQATGEPPVIPPTLDAFVRETQPTSGAPVDAQAGHVPVGATVA